MPTESLIIWILLGTAVVVSAIIGLLVHSQKRRLEVPKDTVSNQHLEALYEALGQSANISDVSYEHQRLKVMIKHLKDVNQAALKSLGIPAALKGKALTLLIKHHTQTYYQYLSQHTKED